MAKRNYVTDLNECMPAAKNAQLGTTIQALIDAVNGFRNFFIGGTGVLEGTGLARGSTDTNIASGLFNFAVNGITANKAAVAAGTAIGAQTVTADKWALYRLTIAANGTITVTPAAGNVAGYADEKAAIAAIPAVPANQADMGYITVKTATGLAWIAATDALAGGTTGNEASITNYYPATPVIPAANVSNLNDLP